MWRYCPPPQKKEKQQEKQQQKTEQNKLPIELISQKTCLFKRSKTIARMTPFFGVSYFHGCICFFNHI